MSTEVNDDVAPERTGRGRRSRCALRPRALPAFIGACLYSCGAFLLLKVGAIRVAR